LFQVQLSSSILFGHGPAGDWLCVSIRVSAEAQFVHILASHPAFPCKNMLRCHCQNLSRLSTPLQHFYQASDSIANSRGQRAKSHALRKPSSHALTQYPPIRPHIRYRILFLGRSAYSLHPLSHLPCLLLLHPPPAITQHQRHSLLQEAALPAKLNGEPSAATTRDVLVVRPRRLRPSSGTPSCAAVSSSDEVALQAEGKIVHAPSVSTEYGSN